MDKLSRLYRLRQLVTEAGGQVDGRKKLHKLAYLCQRAGTDLGQSFLFHMYGVYSPSLARDVEAASVWNLLGETGVGDGYVISLGKEEVTEGTVEQDDGAGFSVVRQLAGQSAAILEVVSTIVYLWDLGYRGAALVQKLKELKRHLSWAFSNSSQLAREHFAVDMPNL